MKVLVTGGAGYVGSHTCVELLRSGYEISVIDSLCNSSIEAVKRIKRLSNCTYKFSECDIRDPEVLDKIFDEFNPDVVIHFAGLKAVSESITEPVKYYDTNVGGTANLLGAMERAGCQKIVFSSSATVYGEPQYLPCDEKHPVNPINPYGRTKLICEYLLRDWAKAKQGRHAIALRYFNPVGADPSGQLGEAAESTPNNLMPLISEVASGHKKFLEVFGGDYDTVDGSGVRDYIHVADVAEAHIAAMRQISAFDHFEVFNIGTGTGLSVLQMIDEFKKQSGIAIEYEVVARRPGDAPAVLADPYKAADQLGFRAKRGIVEMCKDAWRWQKMNPNGYSEK